MKKVIKINILLLVTIFSFIYTDKVINYLNKKNPLMIKIEDIKDNYKTKVVNSYIEDDTIIPGIIGKEVEVDKSYNNMKEGKIFREENLIFKDIYPSELLKDNKDKYIIKGNKDNKVSIIYIISKDNIDIPNNSITLFINHNYLTINNVTRYKDNEIYSYGNNGIYTKDILLNDNTLINRLSNNSSNYCLTKNKNNKVLEVCQSMNMNTIIPNIIGNYLDIKNNLSSGSIILIDNIDNLDIIIKYIESKGYSIVPLSTLLKEAY